jgi:outer membrane protein TolC
MAVLVAVFAGCARLQRRRDPDPGEAQGPLPRGPSTSPRCRRLRPTRSERSVGPTPGAPTIDLAAAVRLALGQAFVLLDSQDAVAASRWRERTAFADFLPAVTPLYQRGEGRNVFGADFSQKLPWTGGTVTASGRYLSEPTVDAPFPRTTDLQAAADAAAAARRGPERHLLRARNARRAVQGQERSLMLARQRTAVEVAAAYYGVIAQRQLLDVARQSLERTEGLLKSSEARLEVGLASKLDVFRAELQAAQARDAMVRAQSALATALERFRGLLALPPGDPVEPEAVALPKPPTSSSRSRCWCGARSTRGSSSRSRATWWTTRGAAPRSPSRTCCRQFDLNVGVTQLGFGSSFGTAWRAGDRQVNVFLSASIPLPQASQRATRAVADLEVGSRQRGVRQRELDVEQEVRQALRELEQIQKSVELQRKAVEVADQQRRLAVLRYQRGLGSNFDVVDAESNLVTSRSALVQLLTSYAVARLDLKRVTGTLDVDTEFAP